MVTQNSRIISLIKMLESEPGDSFIRYALALEYAKAGDDQKAITLLMDLMDQDPKYYGTYYQLGKLFEKTNKVSDAIEIYKLGIKVCDDLKKTKTALELKQALNMLHEDE